MKFTLGLDLGPKFKTHVTLVEVPGLSINLYGGTVLAGTTAHKQELVVWICALFLGPLAIYMSDLSSA